MPAYFTYKAATSISESAWAKVATLSLEHNGLLLVSIIANLVLVAIIRTQRRTHQDAIEKLANAPRELEKIIHPDRTSSRLTARGDSPPGDR